MAKKSGLGNMFDSIFDDSPEASSEGITTMKIGDIEPNRDQPRKDFDLDLLSELAGSIRRHGMIQPLTVCERDGVYVIAAGERRWRAAQMADLDEVPVRIMDLTDAEMAQVALIENLQREDLNPIEEANGYKNLIDKFGLTQEKIADSLGKPRSSVANALRILELPEDVQVMAKYGELSRGHCKALMVVSDDEEKVKLAERAANENLNVRQLEKLCKKAAIVNPGNKRTPPKPPVFFTEAEASLKELTGCPVKVSKKRSGVSVEISCKDEEQLREVMKILGSET